MVDKKELAAVLLELVSAGRVDGSHSLCFRAHGMGR